jgi:sulfate permease, SulP family
MQFGKFKNDFFGGITAAVVALPLALAFGVQSGLGAIAGIYGAITLGFFASLFGGTPSQVSGPTGPMTVITSLAVASMIEAYSGLEAAMPAILLIFVSAGALQILFGILRIGEIVRFIPYPVVSGFMTGIGIIIILLQVFPAVGHTSPKLVLNVLLQLQQAFMHINWTAFSLCATTMAIIYLLPKASRAIPSPVAAIVVLTAISSYFHLTVATIGDIPLGLPSLEISKLFKYDFSYFKLVIEYGLTLAALGSIDSLLTSVVADNMTQVKHNSNRELIGQGIGNMLAACVGGIPGAGATMRTVININAGGRRRLSGMLHSVFLLLVLLGAGRYAGQIPLPVLAGILITVGLSIIDTRGLKHLRHIPRTDALIMLAVTLLTVFVDLLQAVAAGMILATFFFMKKSSEIVQEKSMTAPLRDFQSELTWRDEENLPEHLSHKVYIKHIEGPLFFGFVSQFKAMVKTIPEVNYVIIRMKEVPYIDQSGLYALEDAIMYLNAMGIEVLLTGLHSQPQTMLEQLRIIPQLVKAEHIFEDFSDCVKCLDQILLTQSHAEEGTKQD